MRSFIFRASGLCLVMLVLATAAWADCRSDSEAARTMILDVKQMALGGQKLDSQGFVAKFKPLIDQMTRQKCSGELMNLLELINTERQSIGIPMD